MLLKSHHLDGQVLYCIKAVHALHPTIRFDPSSPSPTFFSFSRLELLELLKFLTIMFVRTAVVSASALLLATLVLAQDEKKCYETGERAIGAEGEERVEWLPCCDGEEPSFVPGYTGEWCGGVAATVNESNGVVESAAGASNPVGGAFANAFSNGNSGGGSGGGFASSSGGRVSAGGGGGGGSGDLKWMGMRLSMRNAARFVRQFEGAAKARYSEE